LLGGRAEITESLSRRPKMAFVVAHLGFPAMARGLT